MGDFDFPQGGETQKTGDSTFRRPTTGENWMILHFVGRRRAVFVVFFISSGDDRRFSRHFWLSEGSEAWKISFSVNPRARMGCFS